MKKLLSTCLMCVLLTSLAFAQKSKPWSEWSKKDVEKMLNDSAWGQTQTEGGADPVNTTVITSTTAPIQRAGESGEAKPTKSVYYRVRFITAKPIREAFARMVLLSQTNPPNDLATQLQGFVDRDFGDLIVVAVNFESADDRNTMFAKQAFGKMTADALKDKVYLERKDGKKLALMDYKPPINDGMGGKFVFPRTLDGQPFLTADSSTVRFYLEVNDKLKINMKFKMSDMTYDGKLEY